MFCNTTDLCNPSWCCVNVCYVEHFLFLLLFLVLKEIEERKEFLNDMAKLGMADKYRMQVNTEISQRIRELEILDSQRTKNSSC